MRATRYFIRCSAGRHSEASAALTAAGDCAIVVRNGVQRQLIIRCPDGCGETLSINLDPRSGPAWRLYQRRGHWSLFPSVDRPTGCLSHFILWNGQVLWCDFSDGDSADAVSPIAADQLLAAMGSSGPVNYVQLADRLDEIPWDVLVVCRRLVNSGVLVEGTGLERGTFWFQSSSGAQEDSLV